MKSSEPSFVVKTGLHFTLNVNMKEESSINVGNEIKVIYWEIAKKS